MSGAMMIFTVGHRESYEKGIDEMGADFQKLGKRDDFQGSPYLGGSVWKSEKEAERYLAVRQLASYAVYGILADWETETEQLPDEPYRRLLVDAQIVALNQCPA